VTRQGPAAVSAIAERLRAAAESGDVATLDGAYAAGARFQAGLPGRRIVGGGAMQALGELWDRPAELVEWDCREHPAGIALWLERCHADGTAQRQRHYLHVADGGIAAHWVYGAPPRSTAPLVEETAGDVFALVGEVAERTPLVSRGWSGARLERATMTDGRRLIAKRIDPAADWISRWTDDPGREGILARDHVLAGLDGIDPATLTAAPDGDAWWIVMRDVSHELLDDASPLERDDHRRIMTALDGMWTAFEDTRIECLATSHRRLGVAGPPVAERERDGHDLLPNQLEAAWEAFLEAVEPDVGEAVVALVTEPEPLAAALDARGTTLIHGDVRDEQLGFAPDGRVVLLDWGIATRGNPAIDLGWYLMHCAWRIRATRDELVDDFRALRDDPVALDLGLLSGVVLYGWILGHSAVVHPDPAERAWAREELDWWVPRARAGLGRL
jgi:hypothetical protein